MRYAYGAGYTPSYYLLIDGCAAININRGNCQNGNELGKLCESCNMLNVICYVLKKASVRQNLQIRIYNLDLLWQTRCRSPVDYVGCKDIEFRFLQRVLLPHVA